MEKYNVLPTVLYKDNIEDTFSSDFKTLMEETADRPANSAHHFSINRYVLNSPQYEKLRIHIESLLTKYFREILDIDGMAMLTQSWVNVNKPTEFTHRHVHPNSFASGVLYLSVQGQNAGIVFHKPTQHSSNTTYSLQPKSTGRDVPHEMVNVRNGDLIVFPSYLPHSVPKNLTSENRWSLAFNALTKDAIGDYGRLTEFKYQ